MNKMAILAGAAALATISASDAAMAQESAAAASSQIDAKAVVADVQRILDANYVLPEMRPKLSAALSQGLAAGRYNVSDPSVLAERINADLTAVANDLRVEQADGVARRRIAEARQEIVRHRGSADGVGRFEHGDLHTLGRKVEGAGQAIVARANNYSIEIHLFPTGMLSRPIVRRDTRRQP